MLARKRSLFENVDRLRTGMKSLLSIFFYGMTGVFSYLNGKAEIRTMTMGKNFFLFLLCPLFGIAGTMLLSLCLKNRKGLCYLGRCTMSVLLMHKFPVLFFQVLMPGVRDWLEWKNIAGICCSIAVTVLVLFLCLAADRILTPIAPWMLGKPGRKKENPSSA